MMISQPALLCLEATLQRLIGRTGAEEWAAMPRPAAGLPALTPATAVREEPPEPARDLGPEPVPRRLTEPGEPAVQPADMAAPLTANERRARAAALRAMALSRGRRFEAARAAFIEASRLDPALDLTRTPAFWSLERAAHEAAIDAYLQTGRDGDAAVLRARVRSTYRPKAVRTPAGAALGT